MPRYRTANGVVVERDADYVSAFPEGAYTLVEEETPLSAMECCGGDDWITDDHDKENG